MDKKSRQQVGMISTLVERFDAWRCVSCAMAFVFAASLLMTATDVFAADPFEGSGNNTRATATAVTFTNDTAKFYGAEIDGTADLDWYSISAAAKDSIDITLANNTTNFNAKIVLYDGSDVKILEADANLGGVGESISGVVLESAGTYYIGVGISTALDKSAGFTTGEYNLDISKVAGAAGDANEVNDTMAAATALSFTANQATASGMVGTLVDQDWFSLTGTKTATARDSINITLDADAALKATLTFYDSTGTAITTVAAAASGEDLTISAYLATYTGTYYIGVSGGTNTGAYSLTVDAESVPIINYPPVASFTISPETGYDDVTTFTFDASASTDDNDTVTALVFSWDFDGDGTYDITDTTAATATNIYADSGSYCVKLMVKDTGDSTNVDSVMVVVRDNASNTAPTAVATVTPATGPVTTEFAFSGATSTDAEDSVSALVFCWDFDGDGTYDVMQSTSPDAAYTYADTGTYTAKLRVRDTGGLKDSTTIEVVVSAAVPNTAPVAAFTLSSTIGAVNETMFYVDASTSSDAEDATADLMVRWDWESDGTFDTDFATAKTANHVFSDTGMFMIKLEVKDSEGLTDTTTQAVQVVRIYPGVKYSLTADSDTATVSFGYNGTWVDVMLKSGSNAGKTIDFIGYDAPLPASLSIEEASSNVIVGYYNISSDSIDNFTAQLVFGYYDSVLTARGAMEDSLGIAYYDETTNAWTDVSVTSTDTVNNELITAVISHFSLWAITYGTITDVPVNPANNNVPNSYELAQNFPNPFNPTTKINFNMVKSGMVQVTIYNILGQRVRTLINEVKSAGTHSMIWDGTSDAGVKLSSGVYIYRMETAGFSSTRKMMLIK